MGGSMKLFLMLAIPILLFILSNCGGGTVKPDDSLFPSTFDPGEGYTLVWSDEFNGTKLDDTRWNIDEGGGGWGNDEFEAYTGRPENLKVTNGNLVITALKENYGDFNNKFTSARINTQGKYEFNYGKLVARIKMPYGKGMWPAFWLLGSNKAKVGWPRCGEIDIAEMKCGGDLGDSIIYSTFHWYNRREQASGMTLVNHEPGKTEDSPLPLYLNYHLFEADWDKESVSMKLDGTEIHSFKITDPALESFQKPFYIIINLAVGGSFVKIHYPEDVTASFPQEMLVDWIRVYQLKK
jgi:beta-glucanase (GH16 family)